MNALRFLGGHAAAGKPERDFWFCGMVNSASRLRTRQKASSIERAGYNKLNGHFGCSNGDVVNAYLERHPNLKRRKGKAASTKTGATDAESAGGASSGEK